MLPGLDNLVRWGYNPVIFSSPVDRIGVYPFTCGIPKTGIESDTLSVITSGKPIHCERTPHRINPLKDGRMYTPVITI